MVQSRGGYRRRAASRAMDVDAVGPSLAGLPSTSSSAPRNTTSARPRRRFSDRPVPAARGSPNNRGRGARNTARSRSINNPRDYQVNVPMPYSGRDSSLSARFQSLYATPSGGQRSIQVTRAGRDNRRGSSRDNSSARGRRGNRNDRRGGDRRSSGNSGRRRPNAPPSADSLDRDLDSYMLRDQAKGRSMLDADLDSYMIGAGNGNNQMTISPSS